MLTVPQLVAFRAKATNSTPTGAALALAREAAGLTRKDLAELANLSGTTVSSAERGSVTDDSLKLLVAALPEEVAPMVIDAYVDSYALPPTLAEVREAMLEALRGGFTAAVARTRQRLQTAKEAAATTETASAGNGAVAEGEEAVVDQGATTDNADQAQQSPDLPANDTAQADQLAE